jgi:hypothetical protein
MKIINTWIDERCTEKGSTDEKEFKEIIKIIQEKYNDGKISFGAYTYALNALEPISKIQPLLIV